MMTEQLPSSMQLSKASWSDLSSSCSQVDTRLVIPDPKAKQEDDVDKLEYQKPAYIAIGLVMIMTSLVVLFPFLVTSEVLGMTQSVWYKPPPSPCPDACKFSLTESIPVNLTYPSGSPSYPSTYESWKTLLERATSSVDIASFYWTLRGDDVKPKDSTSWQGDDIFKRLLAVGKKKGVKLRITENISGDVSSDTDTQVLQNQGAAQVRSLNFTKWFGDGILHTKLWIIDQKHFYIGSANMDWRSLTQVKEMGVIVQDCPCLARDVQKLFDVYWYMGQASQVPPRWPKDLETRYNNATPMEVNLGGQQVNTYISSSPPEFCPEGRTPDIDALLDVIHSAKKFVYIAVMDYSPEIQYPMPPKFWPVIDNALRKVAIEKNIEVRLMASWWKYTRHDMKIFLKSLGAYNSTATGHIYVKLFEVPVVNPQKYVPHTRVNHNKYMVTDNTAFVGTSNWCGGYFINTAGASIIVKQPSDSTDQDSIPQQLTNVFLRDWNSKYAHPPSEWHKLQAISPRYQREFGTEF